MHLVPNIIVLHAYYYSDFNGCKRIISAILITKPFVDSTRVDITVSPMTYLISKQAEELYKENRYHIPTQVY